MSVPASMRTDGRLAVIFVPTSVNINDPDFPALSEITDPDAVTGSCYITDTGFQNSVTENPVVDGRLCQTQDFERKGRKTVGLNLTYVFNTTSVADNLFYAALTEGNTGFIVARYGLPHDEAFAANDVVDVYPVECGFQLKMPKENNSVFKVMQRMFVMDTFVPDACVLAS